MLTLQSSNDSNAILPNVFSIISNIEIENIFTKIFDYTQKYPH